MPPWTMPACTRPMPAASRLTPSQTRRDWAPAAPATPPGRRSGRGRLVVAMSPGLQFLLLGACGCGSMLGESEDERHRCGPVVRFLACEAACCGAVVCCGVVDESGEAREEGRAGWFVGERERKGAMSKLQVKTKYDAAANAATATLALPVGDMKVKATCADNTFVAGGGTSLRGVSFGVEKPGTFIIDYDVQSQAPRFQFMAGASIAQKPVKLTYIHAQKRNATVLEANVAIDARNKVIGKYSFNTHNGTLKYTYVHSSGATFEPSYDFQTEAWHFAASRKVGSHDCARVCYDAHQSSVGMEWTRDSKEYGQFKITATVPMDSSKTSKLVAEKTWSLDF